MNRRNFIQKSVAGSLAAFPLTTMAMNSMPVGDQAFRLKFAPHEGMFAQGGGKVFTDQISYMYDRGFRAIEDNGMLNRSKEEQDKIGNLLAKLGMTMGVFVVDGGDNWKTSLTTGKQEFKDRFVDTCKRSVELAKRVQAKWMTVVPGFYERKLPIGIQTAHVVDALRRGAEIFEPHGLVMVLEPLSDTPDLFLRYSDQTFEICKAVASPACKILYDVYHMQRNEGNLIPSIDRCWDEIAYFQIGDNPGRNEPGTGEINYANIFNMVHKKGYSGVWGMEHGNAMAGKEGEAALIRAYRNVDLKD